MTTPEPVEIDWDATTEPPLGKGSKPAEWDHKAWPEPTPAGVQNAMKSLAILAGRLRFLGGPCWLEDAQERGLLDEVRP